MINLNKEVQRLASAGTVSFDILLSNLLHVIIIHVHVI